MAIQISNKFPFSFTKVLTKTDLSGKNSLQLPTHVSRACQEADMNGEVVLQWRRSSGQKWRLQLEHNLYRTQKRSRFCHGWSKFWHDNKLKVGDCLHITVISQCLLHVDFNARRRNNTIPTMKGTSSNISDKAMLVKRGADQYPTWAMAIKQETNQPPTSAKWHPPSSVNVHAGGHPLCYIKLQASQIQHPFILDMPAQFSSMVTPDSTVTLRMGQKVWTARWLEGALADGWESCCVHGSFTEGDLCIFQMTNLQDVTLQVYIYKENQGKPTS
eukprot:c25715_g1_i1 orf=66-884(-)